jgi:hypothetical protein
MSGVAVSTGKEECLASPLQRISEAFAAFLRIPRIDEDRAGRIKLYMKKELLIHLRDVKKGGEKPVWQQLQGLELGEQAGEGAAGETKGQGIEEENKWRCAWGTGGCGMGGRCFYCDLYAYSVPMDAPWESDTDDEGGEDAPHAFSGQRQEG